MADELDPIAFSPGREEWIEFGADGHRRRIAFHDYAALYAVPGLYERVFGRELGMRSAEVVVGLFAGALAALGRDPGLQRVLDFGAGNGIGGDELRRAGIGGVIGLDLEPEASRAAARDRPGVYDDYLTGDLGSFSPEAFAALRARGFTAVVALSAVGTGHIPAPVLRRSLDLLEPGGLFAFAVTRALLPGGDADGEATGYPDLLSELLSGGRELARREYVHRRRVDGSVDEAVALVGRVG